MSGNYPIKMIHWCLHAGRNYSGPNQTKNRDELKEWPYI